MAKRAAGWLKLYRSTMSNEIWLDGEPFTRGQAWIDLLMMAAYDDMDVIFNGNTVHVKRGEVFTSLNYLVARWNRSKRWVRNTLQLLGGTGMVHTKGTRQGTIITIEKYASYQLLGHTEDITKDNTDAPQYKEYIKKGGGADGSGLSATVDPTSEDRYMRVTNFQTGKVYIYDSVEGRYVDDGEERNS